MAGRRPLVVGASGQLGNQLCLAWQRAGAEAVLRGERRPAEGALNLDLAQLRRPTDVSGMLAGADPDVLVCAGAMTFVDGCEDQPQTAFQVNAYGPSVLAAWAHERGLPFVYYSSDYVFAGDPGRPGPYSEEDPVQPLNVYGRSKLEGERAILRVHPGALVLRTSWVYGPDLAGKNFISFLVRQLRAGERVRVPADQVSTPTNNRDLAEATLALLRAGVAGVVHVTGPELMSRLELGQRVAHFHGLDPALVEGVQTATLGQRAARPLASGLISRRVPLNQGLLSMRPLQKGLSDGSAAWG